MRTLYTFVLSGLSLGLLAVAPYAQEITPLFVELKDPPPTVVARYEAAQRGEAFDEGQHRTLVRQAQDQFLQQLAAAGIAHSLTSTRLAVASEEIDVPDRYADLINALRLEVGGWEVRTIRRLNAVRHLSVDVPKKLVLDHSAPYIRANGADSARSLGVRGSGRIHTDGSASGQVIAVLDTGIHAGVPGVPGHPMFDDRVDDSRFEERNFVTDPDLRPVRLQGTPFIPSLHHTKVVYRALFGLNPVLGDDVGHGTLVATTAAGLKARTGPTDESVILEGVAPGARLMDYKVCPSLVCTNAQILFALEDAIRSTDIGGFPKPRATVVNMSFGDDEGDPDDVVAVAAGNLQFAGVVPVASAGNAGPEENTINSPAANRRVLAIAASLDPGVAPNSIDVLQPDSMVRNHPGPAPDPEALSATGTSFRAVFAPDSNSEMGFRQPLAQYYVDVGLGDTPDQVPASVRGRICLARRGSSVDAGVTGSGLFANKAAQCAALGGIAIVIYNNAPGPIGVVLAPATLPVFTISGQDGLLLRDSLGFESTQFGALSNFPIRLNPPDAGFFVPDTAAFSSRGPNNDFQVVKPDITAPGVEILAGASPTGIPVILGDPDYYNSASGTSFSAPHLSGAAALLRDQLARPAFSPSLVRTALINGSTNLRAPDGTPIPDENENNFLHETGAGLTDARASLSIKGILGTNELNQAGEADDPRHPDFLPSHSFGELGLIGTGFPAGDPVQRRTTAVTLVDLSGTSAEYFLALVDAGALRGDVTGPLRTPGFSVTLGTGSVFVPASSSTTFDVTLAVDGTPGGLQAAAADVNGEPAVEFLWYVVASRLDGSQSLRMPFYARLVPAPGAEAGKVVGAGTIPGTEPDEKSSFGVSARFHGAAPAGHLRYEAGSAGISLRGDVKALSVATLEATLAGPCSLSNGSPCEYRARVEDNAEPGKRADRFAIQVFDSAGRLIHQADQLLSAGNIRIRKQN